MRPVVAVVDPRTAVMRSMITVIGPRVAVVGPRTAVMRSMIAIIDRMTAAMRPMVAVIEATTAVISMIFPMFQRLGGPHEVRTPTFSTTPRK
jgi:hypothetical protein